MSLFFFIIIWLVVVSLITIGLTVYDKLAAKKKLTRIPENTLMYMGVLGGAVAEYIVMQLIRHKTRKKKFMIGLPVIIVLQIIIGCAVYFFFPR